MVKETLETTNTSLLKKHEEDIRSFLEKTGLSTIQAIALFNEISVTNNQELSNNYQQDRERAEHKETIKKLQEEVDQANKKEIETLTHIINKDSAIEIQQNTEDKNIKKELSDIIELHDELRDFFREISPNFKIPYKDGTTSGNINKLINDGKTSEEVCILLYENYIKQLPDYFNTIHKTYSPGSRNSKDGAIAFEKLIENLNSILNKSKKESETISRFVESIITTIINKAEKAKEALINYHDTKFQNTIS